MGRIRAEGLCRALGSSVVTASGGRLHVKGGRPHRQLRKGKQGQAAASCPQQQGPGCRCFRTGHRDKDSNQSNRTETQDPESGKAGTTFGSKRRGLSRTTGQAGGGRRGAAAIGLHATSWARCGCPKPPRTTPPSEGAARRRLARRGLDPARLRGAGACPCLWPL